MSDEYKNVLLGDGETEFSDQGEGVCVCEVKIDVEEECPICKSRFMTKGDMKCPVHRKIMICGRLLPTCQDCIEKGYIYVSGYGGAPYIKDTKLKKRVFIDECDKQKLKEFLGRL